MNTGERLNKLETKQASLEATLNLFIKHTDEALARHEVEMREYREEMRQLKISTDERFARIDEKFDRMSAKIDKLSDKVGDMTKYVSRMSAATIASTISMALAVIYFVATHS